MVAFLSCPCIPGPPWECPVIEIVCLIFSIEEKPGFTGPSFEVVVGPEESGSCGHFAEIDDVTQDRRLFT